MLGLMASDLNPCRAMLSAPLGTNRIAGIESGKSLDLRARRRLA